MFKNVKCNMFFIVGLLQDIIYFLAKLMGCNVIKPLMRDKEIIIIEEVLKNKRPKICLEWGAGYSTLYFSKYLEKDAKWIAVEHDKHWFDKIKRLVRQDSRVSIYYIPPNQSPWTDPYGDGSISDLKDYVTFPEKLNEKIDFILIDGRARKFCLITALKLLKDDGVVILHDANRKYYRSTFRHYKYQVLFEDLRYNDGGLWIGSKLGLDNILNINKHKLNWKILENFSRLEKTIITWLKSQNIT